MVWGMELWDVQPAIEQHTDQSILHADDTRVLMQQISEVEREYSAKLRRVLQGANPRNEDKSTRTAVWRAMLNSIDSVAQQHEALSNSLLAEVGVPLKQLVKDKAEERRALFGEVTTLRGKLGESMRHLEAVRKDYAKLDKEAEVGKKDFEKAERSDNVTKIKVDKARTLYAKKARARDDFVKKLAQETQGVNEVRTIHFHTEVPAVFDRIQAMDESCGVALVKNIAIAGKLYDSLIDNAKGTLQAIQQAAGKHSKFDDSRIFAEIVKTGQPLPGDLPVLPDGARAAPAVNQQQQQQQQQVPVNAAYDDDDDDEQAAAAGSGGQKQVRILYDFPGTNEGELCASANEVLGLLEDDGSGWVLACNAHGQQGYIPHSYIEQ